MEIKDILLIFFIIVSLDVVAIAISITAAVVSYKTYVKTFKSTITDSKQSIEKIMKYDWVSDNIDTIISNNSSESNDVIIDKVIYFLYESGLTNGNIENSSKEYIRMTVLNRLNKMRKKEMVKFKDIKKESISNKLNIDINKDIVTSSDGGVHMTNMFDTDLSNFDNTQYEE
jgi:hypothetical protein